MFNAHSFRLAVLIALAFCASCSSNSTPASPLATTRMVGDAAEPLVAFDRFLDLMAAGELTGDEGRALAAPGFELRHGAQPTTRLFCDTIVRLGDDRAVARVHETTEGRTIAAGAAEPNSPEVCIPTLTMESYWHLRKDGHWRVEGVRSLAYPEFLTVIGYARFDRTAMSAGEVTELEHAVPNARLTLASDAELTAWFREHVAELNALAEQMRAAVPAGEARQVFYRDDSHLDAPLERVKAEVVRLCALSAELSKGHAFDLVIGGAADNTVLFRHVPWGEPPHVSIDDVIWAEDLGGGWFLVKTT